MSKSFTPSSPLNTAVLFLVFNRPNTTEQVFEAIRKAKPPRLYVAADGSREDQHGEEKRVEEVRSIATNVDWDCEVKTLYRDKNLGCKYAVSSAITWFFKHEEQGIILEDDCLPSQSFFWFCEELLYKYLEDERIYLISGYNKQNEWKLDNQSYFFSHFGGIWGWASWRRAWKDYDVDMADIDQFISENHFENLLGKNLGRLRQNVIYNNIIVNQINSWDYQWAYTRHKNSGLACVPVKSLVENIGFGEDATHTIGDNDDHVVRHEINFPLIQNKFIVPDRIYDEKYISRKSLLKRLIKRVQQTYKLIFK